MSRLCLACAAVLCGLVLTTGCDNEPVVPRRDLDLVKRARIQGANPEPAEGQCTTKRTFYRDADGDGFGDPKKPVKACAAPPGFVANRDDCYDQNRRARPTQHEYFAEDRGDGSFDYDCDGRQVRRFTTRAFCREKQSGGCALASGWVGKHIPRCGEPQDFAWKVCKERVLVKPPEPMGATPGVPTDGMPAPGASPTPAAPASQSNGALVPGAKQQKIYSCGGHKLPWKKRQLCR